MLPNINRLENENFVSLLDEVVIFNVLYAYMIEEQLRKVLNHLLQSKLLEVYQADIIIVRFLSRSKIAASITLDNNNEQNYDNCLESLDKYELYSKIDFIPVSLPASIKKSQSHHKVCKSSFSDS